MTTDHAPVDLEAARDTRLDRMSEIRQASALVRRVQKAFELAVDQRDRLLIEYHGDRRTGGLSYEDLSEATGEADEGGISKGRVIQIVQGKSEYSKRQPRVTTTPPTEE